MSTRLRELGLLSVLALALGACAAGQAFRLGEAAMRAGNLDEAVARYRQAVQASPDDARAKIALERAMQAASRAHLERAESYEKREQLEAALGEFRLASEYDPSNRVLANRVASLQRTLRDRAEANRPKPPSQAVREQVRAASQPPILNPASREPLVINVPNAGFKDVLSFIGTAAGINISYDREVADRPTSVQLNGVTLEQALNTIMTMNQLSYKIVNGRSIFVFSDTAQKHAQYDEQVVNTFFIQHADATELTQILSQVIRLPGIAVQPAIAANKTNNSITVRSTSSVMQIMQRIIDQNDQPRAEIVFDIEILEVDRTRVKQYGLNLSEFALGGVFSPEATPASTSTPPSGAVPPPPISVSTFSRGIGASDFYLAVPTAIVKFLESDSHTKLVAKPQLRGAEGSKLTLNLGDEVPIVSTSYTPIATGGVGVNPLNSFQLKPVGINVEITVNRVTFDDDILLDLNVESSSRGSDVNVAGTNYPSFGSRKVGTRLRLRDGESNLLAGLLREDEAITTSGFPGAIHVPLLKQLLSNNDQRTAQTDIIMLLTPHIVRTRDVTAQSLQPIYIGSQQNLGVGGPPPLIAPTPAESTTPAAPTTNQPIGGLQPQPPAAAPGALASPSLAPQGTTLEPPAGSSPVPGFVVVPRTQAAAAPPPQAQSPAESPAISAAQPAPAPESAVTSPGTGSAQVILSPPGTTFRVGQGPYTVPLSIVGASRLSTITLTLSFDPTVLRVRSVQEGSFMRTGGVNAAFVQQVSPGRVDITIARPPDSTGASGAGLLGAVVLDAVAAGAATLTLSGSATGPAGTAMGLAFRPVTVAVQ